MLVKNIDECKSFEAGDKSILREVLHPAKDNAKIRYSIAHAIVKPGKRTVDHSLGATEVYIILEGQGTAHIDSETREVKKGDIVYIPANSVQKIENTGTEDLVFLCVVDPAWSKQMEKVLE